MKSRVLKLGLCVIILLSLVAASFALVRPVYVGLGNILRAKIAELNSTLDKSFGITVSYSSLSPSILTGISVKGIEVKDSATGEPILTVKNATARYSLGQIFNKNFDNAISEIIIHDVYAEIIRDKNTTWLTYALEKNLEKEEQADKQQKKSTLEILSDSDINIQIPFDVNINNLTVIYKDYKAGINAEGTFRRAYIEKTYAPGKYSVELIGRLSGAQKTNKFSASVFLQSSFLSRLNNSTAVIQLFNINYNSFSISQIGFLADYVDYNFSFKMLPTIQNLYLELSANLKTHDVKCRMDCNNFRVSQVVQGIKSGSTASTVASLLISSQLKIFYNTESQKLNYSSSGDVFISNGIVPGSLSVSYALDGDRYHLNIPYLNGTGDLVDAGFSGSVNLRTIQPEGVLSVNRITLENGGIISSEFFIEPLERGFMVFSPEIYFGDKTFTAAQFNLIPQSDGFDFDFDVYDYSHAESGEPGYLKLTGNYLTASKYFQSNITLNGLYIDSLMQTTAFFLDKNTAGLINDSSNIFSNIIFSTDVYVSSYGGNFSYSIPTAIIADTTSDSKMLIFSVDGNKDSIQLNRFELVFNEQKINAVAHSENMIEPSTRQMQTIVTGQVEYNSIPYVFSGLINKDWINITGDYGFNFSFLSDKETDSLLGTFAMNEFPVKLKDSTLSLSCDTSFSYNLENKLNMNVTQFLIQSINGLSDTNPAFVFSGRVDKSGAFLEQIGYTDTVSNLAGNGAVIWNFEDVDFISANYDISLADPLYNERVVISGEISNPSRKKLELNSFLNDFYISAAAEVTGFRTGRFTGDTLSNDTMNAEFSLTGILSNPLLSISIPNGTFSVNNIPMTISLQATVVDREFELEQASIKWGTTKVENITSKISFNEWTGFVSCVAETVVMDKTLVAPLTASFKGIKSEEKKSALPESYEIDISTPKLSGSFIKSQQPLSVHILSMSDQTLISSSANMGLTGYIKANGEMSLVIDNQIPFKLKIAGNTKSKSADLRFYDIDIDLAKATKLIDFSLMKIYNGKVIGEFKIKGPADNRGFDGQVMIIPAEFSMPQFFKAHAKTDVIYLHFDKDTISTPKTRCMLKRTPVDVTVNVFFKKMHLDNISVLVKTLDDNYAPININMNQVHVKGNAQVDLDINVDNELIVVQGALTVKDATAEFGTSTVDDIVAAFNTSDVQEESNVQVNLDVTMQSRVQVYYGSFLRGLVVPGSRVTFAYDMFDDKMTLDGDVPLRSGEIIYLNSSFYVKEGRITFSEKDNGVDPYVSLRAETRERDDNNNDVTISLSVDHQKISELSPKLTSSPAKSEKEIMELLGSFVSAQSDSMASFILATGDYALQTMVVRRVENALRDFLNFDILSIRSMVVQNAVKYGISPESSKQGMTISNFFDNTTVYVGKYLGNSLYLDALLRLSYNKNRINDESTLQGLIFKPEIGLEMESPLANIRWSLAPDLSDLSRNRIMLIPSLTLSWKFNY